MTKLQKILTSAVILSNFAIPATAQTLNLNDAQDLAKTETNKIVSDFYSQNNFNSANGSNSVASLSAKGNVLYAKSLQAAQRLAIQHKNDQIIGASNSADATCSDVWTGTVWPAAKTGLGVIGSSIGDQALIKDSILGGLGTAATAGYITVLHTTQCIDNPTYWTFGGEILAGVITSISAM